MVGKCDSSHVDVGVNRDYTTARSCVQYQEQRCLSAVREVSAPLVFNFQPGNIRVGVCMGRRVPLQSINSTR